MSLLTTNTCILILLCFLMNGCDPINHSPRPAPSTSATLIPTPSPSTTPTPKPSATPVGELTWYTTCGDPVCREYRPIEGLQPCALEMEGQPCSKEGAMCDPKSACNQRLICSRTDPKLQPGGCPISLKKYKDEVQYLQDKELTRIYQDLLKIRLATYHYKQQNPALVRLGFIIDDRPHPFVVNPTGNTVDLYGYLSMAVAGLQVQSQKLNALQKKVDEMQKHGCGYVAHPKHAPKHERVSPD